MEHAERATRVLLHRRRESPLPVQAIDASVWAAAAALASLAAHAAWHAANARSFLWSASRRDLDKLEAVTEVLENLMPAAIARAIHQLALSVSWYASNTRRLLLLDAARDWRRFCETTNFLSLHLPDFLVRALKILTTSAAWHAANARSMLWADAERDVRRFEECCRRLPALLQKSSICSLEENHDFPALHVQPKMMSPRTPRRARPTDSHVPRTVSTLTRSGREALQRTHCVLDDLIPLWRTVAKSCDDTFQDVFSINNGDNSADGPARAAGGATCDRNVSIGHGMCSDFLEAANATAAMFECLGPTVAPMASELQKNTEKLRKAMLLRPGLSIREIIREEASMRGIGRRRAADVAVEGSASLALIWLNRLLRMLLGILARMVEDPHIKLSECIARSYDESLRPYHSLWTQRVILAAAWAAPSRVDFLSRLGSDQLAIEQSIYELLTHLAPALASVGADVASVLGNEKDSDGL